MKSFIPWVGGKSLLAKKIVALFPDDINRYIEVFGGGGSVMFCKEKHADLEVYNDFNSDLVNLFRCAKYHRAELQREISGYFNSREMFEDIKAKMNIRGFTDIQRAAMFYVRIKISYGSDIRTFSCKGNNLSSDYLEPIEKRLKRVVIENKDFENLIKVYDRPKALFYCDPPYHKTENYYDATFTEADHERLKVILSGIKGRFVLSYNDDEYIRELYKDFKIIPIERQN
ncbi:MAG: DNA adenine methylase, partial [Ruminococcus sp.]|nr:DNA adenine methylase [Ruminococcus sp.]